MTDYYEQHGKELASRYDALDAAQIHGPWAGLLSQIPPGLACDMGAGSGRDARWLARQGWEVVAVEPGDTMRDSGRRASKGQAITWLKDSLPSLRRVREIGVRFDLILLSAVWQHIAPEDRDRAFGNIADLLGPGGRIVITLRHGKNRRENEERGFFAVDGGELRACARQRSLIAVEHGTAQDLRRADVEWETLEFLLPDDGSGGRR